MTVVTPEISLGIDPKIAECPRNFEIPCKPAICPMPEEECLFKAKILTATKNPDCERCWPVEGNNPSYMQGTFYPDLRGTNCIEPEKRQCEINQLIAVRAEIAAKDTNTSSNGNGNSHKRRIGF